MKKQPKDLNKDQTNIYDIELAEENRANGEYANDDESVAKRQQEFIDIQTTKDYVKKQQ